MHRRNFDGSSSWILTHCGFKIEPLNLDPALVCIEDIAHALSQQCRWSGHCNRPHYVASHSVMVSLLCDPKDSLSGLLHDASEAYLVDLNTPTKRQMPEYMTAESNAMHVIMTKFGLPTFMPKSVIEADQTVLAMEYRDIMPHHRDFPQLRKPPILKTPNWSPDQSKREFLKRFFELGGRCHDSDPGSIGACVG